MWCKHCNLETNESACPVCGEKTVEDLPVEVFWCRHCEIPVIQAANQADKGTCPLCHGKAKHLVSDLRPVFPEERLLLAALQGKRPSEYMDQPVWAANSRYYIGDRAIALSPQMYQDVDTDLIAKEISEAAGYIDYASFDENIQKFI